MFLPVHNHICMLPLGSSRYLDKVAGDVPASDVQTSRQVREAETLIHRTDVCHTVTRVYDYTGEKA